MVCTCILPEICRFGVQNVKLGKIGPRRFIGLEKTKLDLKFEGPISKNKDLVTQCTLQKVWKIALLSGRFFQILWPSHNIPTLRIEFVRTRLLF